MKDTFYTALRDRLAAVNPARTMVVRGTVRPALLVAENELPGAAVDGISQPETFCLRWTGLAIDPQGLAHLHCEIRYGVDGSTGAAGMDRGRALTAMDQELGAAVARAPQSAELISAREIDGGGALVATDQDTRIFWSAVTFGATTLRAGRMERTATLEVFGYE